MSNYGIDAYGRGRYGPKVFLDFDASPMAAVALDYGRLLVSWSTPTGNWSKLRLVRNAFGIPVAQDDGSVLFEGNFGPVATGTKDSIVRSLFDLDLTGGRFYYYAIYLYVPSVDQWTRAAYTTGLALKDYGYADRLWALTPTIHRSKTSSLLDVENTELRNFLRVPAQQLDHVRAEYESLRYTNDPAKVSGGLLPLMAQQWGQLYEPELGMRQMRALLRNSVRLYRTKGTQPGIEGFASALTGFGARIRAIKNIMLDFNDSSAEQSIGNWTGFVGCNMSRYLPDNVVNAATLSPMGQAGIFRVVATAAGTLSASLGSDSPLLKALPVDAGTTYTGSVYLRPSATTRSVTLDFFWYDIAGTLLSSENGPSTTGSVTAWTRSSHTQLAPANAARLGLQLRVIGVAVNEVHFFDALQVEVGSAVTAYEDARLIDIDLIAPRINLVTNPSGESGTSTLAAGNGTLTTVSSTTAPSGSAYFRLTTAAANAATFIRQDTAAANQIPVSAGNSYAVSASVRRPSDNSTVRLTLLWYDSTGAALTPAFTTMDVSSQVPTAATWTRVSAAIQAPVGAVTAQLSVDFGSTVAPNQNYDVDALLVEQGVTVNPYFDGNSSYEDALWEGTANLSRSHLYPQYRTKRYRLTQMLPQYTPMGSTFRVNFASTV